MRHVPQVLLLKMVLMFDFKFTNVSTCLMFLGMVL